MTTAFILGFSSVPENGNDLPIVWFGHVQLIGPQSLGVTACVHLNVWSIIDLE